jgi:hypothetical protein
MPRSARMRTKMARAAGACSGRRLAARDTSATSTASVGALRAASSRWSRACMDSASSTPPAPPPTTTSRTRSATAPGRFAAAAPARSAMSHARRRIASQRAANPSMGFTGVTGAAAPAPSAPQPAAAPAGPGAAGSCGAEPMLTERTSKGISGRPRTRTTRAERSTPVASACTSRTPAKLASLPRSMWHLPRRRGARGAGVSTGGRLDGRADARRCEQSYGEDDEELSS